MDESPFRYLTYLTEDGVPGFQPRAFGPRKGDEDRGYHHAGYVYATSFSILQVISDSAATFGSDSVAILAQFRGYLPCPTCVGKGTSTPSFWFCSELQ
jgi:hypothetical protein